MLIIVEGPNCAGKSTFVEHLKKWFENNVPDQTTGVLHAGPPTSHPVHEYVWPLLEYRPNTRVNIICDRWHWGEAVYPDVWDRSTQMDRGVWRYVEMFLRSRGAVVVYPYVSAVTLTERHRLRGDSLIKAEQIPREWAAYNAVRFRSILPVQMMTQQPKYDDDQLNRVIQLAEEHAVRAAALNDIVTYIGPARPDFLLVGDARNRRREVPQAPAFGPFPATSGHFLMNALSGPRLASLGIMNANDVDDFYPSWVTLGSPPIVALGRRASHKLDGDGVWGPVFDIPHSRVPHPQFIRRFHHRYQAEYGAIIDSAMATRKDLSKWRP